MADNGPWDMELKTKVFGCSRLSFSFTLAAWCGISLLVAALRVSAWFRVLRWLSVSLPLLSQFPSA